MIEQFHFFIYIATELENPITSPTSDIIQFDISSISPPLNNPYKQQQHIIKMHFLLWLVSIFLISPTFCCLCLIYESFFWWYYIFTQKGKPHEPCTFINLILQYLDGSKSKNKRISLKPQQRQTTKKSRIFVVGSNGSVKKHIIIFHGKLYYTN